MKILIINSVCGKGSTGKIVADLANGLISEGHDCLVAYGRDRAKGYHSAYKITSDFGVILHALLTRLFGSCGLHSNNATKKLLKKIDEYSPDIIHIHNLHGYYINYKILFDYLKKSNIPVVWTLHDCWAFTGHCSYYDFAGCSKWQERCYGCPQIKEYPKSFIDASKRNYFIKKEAFSGVKNLTIITPSKWLKDEVKKSFLGGYNIKVIKNGINTEVFKPIDTSEKESDVDKKIIILGVANIWNRRKGLHVFEQIYNILPKDKYQIMLVGLSKSQIKRLPKGIIKLSRTKSASELAAIYSAADVFVNPTFEDNYPTVNLEAQACGTPVITFDTGGSAETLSKDIAQNKLIPKGDIDALAEALKNINKKPHPRLIDNTYLSKDIFLAESLKLYKQILGG